MRRLNPSLSSSKNLANSCARDWSDSRSPGRIGGSLEVEACADWIPSKYSSWESGGTSAEKTFEDVCARDAAWLKYASNEVWEIIRRVAVCFTLFRVLASLAVSTLNRYCTTTNDALQVKCSTPESCCCTPHDEEESK